MKIAIIGASAGVGIETVKRALDRKHEVTTLSRSEIQLPSNPNLKSIIGSALNKADFQKTIENADSILITLGTGTNLKATTLYSDFAKLLIELHQESKFKIPIIIVTGFGAGESGKFHKNFIMKLFFRLLLIDIYTNKTIMEEMISKTDIKWEIVRPGVLTNGPLTEKYRIENQLFKGMNIGKISRADVGDFIVKQAENPNELGKFPALSY
ncbi:MAG: NAD(P)H-binding protein [Bacteroidota bacterium]